MDPRTARDAATRPALERTVRDLRYGTVSLNTWSAAGYGIGITPWGAHPGNPRHAIGSGTGFVHNPLMFERAEKTVIRGPFRPWPKPPWFSSHRRAHRLMPELTRFEADKHPGSPAADPVVRDPRLTDSPREPGCRRRPDGPGGPAP